MSTTSKTKLSGANWWITLLKGLMFIVFGIWLLNSPSENLSRLSIIFGILIIAGGLLEVGLAFNNRQLLKKWEWTLTSGMLDVLFGAFLIANPAIILWLISMFVSIWLFIRGIIAIRNALILKKTNSPNYNYSLILGVILVVLALIFALRPQVIGITLVFWTALAFICLGIFRIVLVLKINAVKN